MDSIIYRCSLKKSLTEDIKIYDAYTNDKTLVKLILFKHILYYVMHKNSCDINKAIYHIINILDDLSTDNHTDHNIFTLLNMMTCHNVKNIDDILYFKNYNLINNLKTLALKCINNLSVFKISKKVDDVDKYILHPDKKQQYDSLIYSCKAYLKNIQLK